MEALLLPPSVQRRSAFYPDAFGQSIAAFAIVVGCAGSPILIAYFTPTVGLECRSSGYILNLTGAVTLAFLETCMWNLADNRNTAFRSWAGGILAFMEAINTIWTVFIPS